MKRATLVFFILFLLSLADKGYSAAGGSQTLAVEYSELSRPQRDSIEWVLADIVPAYTQAMLNTLFELNEGARQPLATGSWVAKVKYKRQYDYKEIFRKNAPSEVFPENKWIETTDIKVRELIQALYGGLEVQTCVENKAKWSPEEYESLYLDRLNQQIDVAFVSEEIVRVEVVGMSRPYCVIQITSVKGDQRAWTAKADEVCGL